MCDYSCCLFSRRRNPNPKRVVRTWKLEVFDELLRHVVVVVLTAMSKQEGDFALLQRPDNGRHLYDFRSSAHDYHDGFHSRVFTMSSLFQTALSRFVDCSFA